MVRRIAGSAEGRAEILVSIACELANHAETPAEREALERAAMLLSAAATHLRTVRMGEVAPLAETFATVKEAA